jgi:hypothetical protein
LLARFAARPDARHGHGLRHRQRFVLASAAVATLLDACGDRAFETTGKNLTPRQLRALGCQREAADGRYYSPSDSTFQRVLKRLKANRTQRHGGRRTAVKNGTTRRWPAKGTLPPFTSAA